MAKLEPQFIRPSELSEDTITAIVGIGRQQALLMDQLDQALARGDNEAALEVARHLVLSEKEVRSQ
jgi:hypothetical protein